MSTALLERPIAVPLGGTRWTLTAASSEVASGSDPTPEQRLALLQARARRRAATSLRYPDPADEADELHATVLGALPAQLRAVANIDESN